MKQPHPLRRLLADLTDGLFGYRLRYKRWRRWPLLVVLFLVWFPLSFLVVLALLDGASGASIRGSLRREAKDLISCGAFGQFLVNGIVLVFVPLLASRAFAREKAGGNMMDLVLLPVERRRIVVGRLARTLLPFVLLVLWSLPAYLAVPVAKAGAPYYDDWWIQEWYGRYAMRLPLVWQGLLSPLAFSIPLEIPRGLCETIGDLANHLTGLAPWFTVLTGAILLGTFGLYLSLRLRRPLVATAMTYVLGFAWMALEMLPLAVIALAANKYWSGRVSFKQIELIAVGLGGGALVLLRLLVPVLLLRSAIRNFDRWALGEK